MLAKKTAALTFATALALSVLAPSATATTTTSVASAPTANQLKVTKVGTDAMGSDTFTNRNREYVTFKNVSDGPLDIANVVVEDNWAHNRTLMSGPSTHTCNTYKITDLPDNPTTDIAMNETVTVFNGAGTNVKVGTEYRLFANSDTDCGTLGHFYNNDNDTAWVTKVDGTPITKRSWDWGGGYFVFGSLPLS